MRASRIVARLPNALIPAGFAPIFQPSAAAVSGSQKQLRKTQ
jgi:hypothetical protein